MSIARFASAETCGRVVDQMWRTHPSSTFVIRQDEQTGEFVVYAEGKQR